ncbi:ImmA/IrrE family metallo-endopeptidase [Variovorax sp. CY25R-8]|uniref:ImmA/IrrE family metallo-endopeptidase n=1 Tax=Variovorax sp. CY25R-8 TaxID=2855501 RepID=UPI0021BADDA8|nr:ImmA/IrrE family metallo-endopeptidase [Variovorax sp. CY25R-8]MCT8178911.1 ImmA/IrrE family metallo-endopeptidase [Variovorax sp. CY25R-8]
MAIEFALLSPPEKLLWQCGVRDSSHIDLEAIANYRGAEVVYRPLCGCAARLVAAGDKAVISVDEGSYPGRQRFSLAHELAHWICDKDRGSFRCANEDIGPQNAEAKNVEAYANAYASQLILPTFLVDPWLAGKRINLDTAKALGHDFDASLTASAIKVARRAQVQTCVVCHNQTKRIWVQKSVAFPHDFYIKQELHQDTAAFSMAFGKGAGLSRPVKEAADRWLQGPEIYRRTVETQSLKLPDGAVLTMITLLSSR